MTPRGHRPGCGCLACSPPSVRERLFAHRRITPSGCWEWTRGCDEFGYGQMTVADESRSVHRLAYEELVGPIPAGQSVLHHCDNPPCWNPAHLFLGTQLTNMRDRNAKGRDNNYWRSRLTCVRGHAWTPANTKWRTGEKPQRVCRACCRLRGERRRKRASRAAA